MRLVHNINATCNLDLNNVVTTCYVPGGGCVYSSTAPTNILDEATVTNSITVPSLGAQVITDLNVYVNITHTYIGDLLISLQSPTGTIIPLVSTGVCGGNPNMTVEFDQQATTGIGVVCPMNNIFAIPAASLAGFNGELMQGTWTLIVQDAVGGDFGTLNSWCLIPTLGAGGVQVSPKVLLEGPYNATTGIMSDALRSASLIPATQPYTDLGYVFIGSPGAGGTIGAGVLTTSGNDAIVDWVIVELRSTTLSTTVVASCAALLQRDGDVVALDGISPVSMAVPAGSYHVAVLHRNHLGAMTFSGVALSATTAVVDLRSAATATYGTNARKTMSGAFPAQVLWAGDASFNGIIKYTGADNDRDPILQAIGGNLPTNTISGYHQEDVNMDTQVKYTGSANDRDPILQNIGGTVPTNTRVEQLP